MKETRRYPRVVLIGRTNVGKSTLFNRLIKGGKSLVFDREGVTRDYIADLVSWDGKSFELIDTGGFPLAKQQDPISEEVRSRVLELMNDADLLIFVGDVKSGLTLQDQRIGKMVHKTGVPAIAVVNKADNKAAYEEHIHEFYGLGFDEIIPVSAEHGVGIAALLDRVLDMLAITVPKKEIAKPSYKVTIIGRPNVGKSSLLNLLLKQERAIVSEVPGTTREPIRERLVFHKEVIEVIDTAGMRRKGKIDDALETLMVKSALQAIRDADIVIVVVDTSFGRLTDQELKLIFYAYESKKCIILVFNKIDLLDDMAKEAFKYQLKPYEFILKKIPQVWLSCSTQKNIGKVLKVMQEVRRRAQQKFVSSKVDDVVKNALHKKPLYSAGKLLKIFKIRWVPGRVPTFVLHVSAPELFRDSHLGFIENVLRKNYDLLGCPVHLIVREG